MSVGVAVGRIGVAVGVSVGVPVSVLVGVFVGGVESTSSSYAPISQAAPCGRVTPRWSVAGQPVFVPVSMAGEPASRAWVCVKPPLFASVPRLGSCPMMFPFTPFVKLQALRLSSIRLLEEAAFSVLKLLTQSPPLALLAMRVFVSVGLLELKLYIPPPEPAELALKVTFVSVGLLRSLYIPPPL